MFAKIFEHRSPATQWRMLKRKYWIAPYPSRMPRTIMPNRWRWYSFYVSFLNQSIAALSESDAQDSNPFQISLLFQNQMLRSIPLSFKRLQELRNPMKPWKMRCQRHRKGKWLAVRNCRAKCRQLLRRAKAHPYIILQRSTVPCSSLLRYGKRS